MTQTVKESACNAGDPGSVSELERSAEQGNGYPFHSPGDLSDTRIESASPSSPSLAVRFLTTEPPGKSLRKNPQQTESISTLKESYIMSKWDFKLPRWH